MSGVKHDAEKPMMALVPSKAILEVGKLMSFGAKKYAAHNWLGGIAYLRLASAALRHLLAWISGEEKDPESELSHLAHCACCILMLLEFTVTERDSLDDRYKPDGT